MLSKEPKNLEKYFLPKKYFLSARASFSKILKVIDFSDRGVILLPAYIGITDREGSGVFDPILENNIEYQFYDLDILLRPNTKNLYEALKNRNVRALLVIHYFGFCQNKMHDLIEICKQNNVILIEDCAHVLPGIKNIYRLGDFGDFSFYSLHKHLPVDNGGVLKVNNAKYFNLFSFKNNACNVLDPQTIDVILRSNYLEIGNKRIRNYNLLLPLISRIKFLEVLYTEIPDGIFPHDFPVIVKHHKREILYFYLIDKGIPVTALYYRLIDEINEGGFAESKYVSNNILNFPIHQDIEKEDILYIFKVLSDFDE